MSKYIVLFIAGILCFFTSCYRMPEEGEVSVVPTTNNPSITRQSGGLTPGIDF
jgi:hypothetical protein